MKPPSGLYKYCNFKKDAEQDNNRKRSELVLRFSMQLASSVAINYVIEEDKFECKTINIYNLRHLFDVAEALADEAIRRGHVV